MRYSPSGFGGRVRAIDAHMVTVERGMTGQRLINAGRLAIKIWVICD
jgi:hypothetical protein